jgi:hypothetical protein
MESNEGFSGGGSTPTMSSGPASGGGMNSANHESSEGFTPSFSSKGLSEFKGIGGGREVPTVDINNGKTSSSMFKNPNDLGKEKGMFNISKPVFQEKQEGIKGHFESSNSQVKSPELQDKKIADINHGKETKPFFKNTYDLKPKGMFDISKPIFSEKTEALKPADDETKKESLGEKPSEKVVPKAEKAIFEVLKIPNLESLNAPPKRNYEVSQPREQQKTPELKSFDEKPQLLEPLTEVYLYAIDEAKSGVLNKPRTDTEFHTQSRTEKKVRTEVLTHPEVQQVLHVEPETHPVIQTEKEQQIEQEVVAEVQILLAPEVMSETKVSLAEARAAIEKVIEGKKPLETVTETETVEQKNPTHKAKKATIEEKAREIYKKRKEEIAQNIEEKKSKLPEPEFLFIQKDKKANSYREMAVLFAAQRLQVQGREATGQTIAENVSSNIKNHGNSEIVEDLQDDESVNDFVEEVRKIGKVENIWTLQRKLKGIIGKITAVRLSFSSKDVVEKEDAVRVYGKPLDKVDANVRDDGSVGKLLEEETGKVVYINKKNTQGYSVEPSE